MNRLVQTWKWKSETGEQIRNYNRRWSLDRPRSRLHACRSVLVQRELEEKRSPLVSIPPCGRGFSRHPGLSIRCIREGARKTNFRAREHRLDEPARLSLGMVASLQSPLPFHPAKSL